MSVKSKLISWLAQRGYRIVKEPLAPIASDFLFEVTYLDVGSSGGLPPKWQPYASNQNFKLILIEPDAHEAKVLKLRYPNAIVVPHALGKTKSLTSLNVAHNPACSSLLEPDFSVLNRFPVKEWFAIDKKIEVAIFPFDELARDLKIPAPDFVKMDVQGYESEVLHGFGEYLERVLCIELETHLIPIYKNQVTLEELTAFLFSKGFFLRHLGSTGIFEDEVVEFDAFFVKLPQLIKSDLERKKIDFWSRVNKLQPGNYFSDWNK